MNTNSDTKVPAKPSKRPVGRPKGSRNRAPRRKPEQPVLWTFTWFGRVFRFQEEVPAFKRFAAKLILGGVWRSKHE